MPGNKVTSPLVRVWKRIVKAGPDDCWLWYGATNNAGYGHLGAAPRKTIAAHRAAYESAVGPIPPGVHVLHRCDNPPCCNPAHLWLGTAADNAADKVKKGRARAVYHWRGEGNAKAKLTAAQVLEIARSSGSPGETAKRYGVCYSTIHQIRRGLIWSHITGII